MQEAGGGITSSSKTPSNNGKEEGGGMALKKGPWMAEEDEILIEYVRKHGPRDWSSIRSKGLLPRSGKSCRLRWVNKLKPDLKTGCKFSPEEERIVIDLQARFGNKWARIATYLPGRTDNDVKNFWSTRQKRLARILRTPLPSRSNKNHGKMPVPSHQLPNLEDPSLDRILFEGDGQCSQEASKMTQMRDILSPVPLDLHTALPLLELELAMEKEPCLSDTAPPSQPPFDHLPHPLVGLPVLPEDAPGLSPGFGDASFPEELACPEPPPEGLPFLGLDAGHDGIERVDEHPGDFFDDLPADMFDYLEPPTPPPPPPPASSTSW
ncbi:probable transcription factor MYB58 [Phoenix dactylifera]|uniref:Probable transcription factor MYB58 n=1 Tax=Phoenix dactylifera TaxID=42345 RepID=A0A8B7BJ80_PHODC|nr:probable transcription factor MYB58 [Phoenix dactylifera]